ncbi:hypothetical protein GOP47_0030291 [Adiantum capillus-veneris]|nr:hypothetical protein GOP47_0030291 [Adiantum capillus-veneris]
MVQWNAHGQAARVGSSEMHHVEPTMDSLDGRSAFYNLHGILTPHNIAWCDRVEVMIDKPLIQHTTLLGVRYDRKASYTA